MALSEVLSKVVEWLREGYPHGVPEHDYIPLLALLARRLTKEEIRQVTDALIEAGALPADRVDAGVAISEITDELPRESDLDRVRSHLVANGWPVDDDWSEK
ncbi:DUF3349 domain-containing protein [Nocardia sp. CA2R105]|jgi:hypothetical protein|uniref:DUF3349 domain-containing protein n=1 Tax=Nocardia coffeae TaxID=2873381 RepID=UPI001CA6B984|nr:DUF3349 domain-containing protein [Nocardia coffeae]MBY8860590.1 DUF3349 domain-containing protein [Nocardia coffeae]